MDKNNNCDAFVFFGASGDLAKKQIFPALARLVEKGVIDFPVIGSALSDWKDDDLRARAKDSLQASGQFTESRFKALAERLRYVCGDFAKEETFTELAKALGDAKRPIFYMAVPPDLFEEVSVKLAQTGCLRDGRLVIEKPFGADLESAKKLNLTLSKICPDERIYRIDHYLGKESVENVATFHQDNILVRAGWGCECIDHIQITMAEKFGVTDRGSFYDSQGTIRDVVQNHLLQVLANLLLKHEKSSVTQTTAETRYEALKLVAPARIEDAVFGQYEGYSSIEGVKPNSITETFVAMKIEIVDGPLKGVPVFIRAGKQLPETSTELHIVYKPFDSSYEGCDTIGLEVTPNESVRVSLTVKASGSDHKQKRIDLSSGALNEDQDPPYVRLLGDAISGKKMLFSNEDCVERCWEIIDSLLARQEKPKTYEPGTWALSEELQPPGGWRIHP